MPANSMVGPKRLVRGSPQKSTALQRCVPTVFQMGAEECVDSTAPFWPFTPSGVVLARTHFAIGAVKLL